MTISLCFCSSSAIPAYSVQIGKVRQPLSKNILQILLHGYLGIARLTSCWVQPIGIAAAGSEKPIELEAITRTYVACNSDKPAQVGFAVLDL